MERVLDVERDLANGGRVTADAEWGDQDVDRRPRRRNGAMAERLPPTGDALIGINAHQQDLHTRAGRACHFGDRPIDAHGHAYDDCLNRGDLDKPSSAAGCSLVSLSYRSG